MHQMQSVVSTVVHTRSRLPPFIPPRPLLNSLVSLSPFFSIRFVNYRARHARSMGLLPPVRSKEGVVFSKRFRIADDPTMLPPTAQLTPAPAMPLTIHHPHPHPIAPQSATRPGQQVSHQSEMATRSVSAPSALTPLALLSASAKLSGAGKPQ